MGSAFITDRDPGDENDYTLVIPIRKIIGKVFITEEVLRASVLGPGEPGFPGVPRGTSQPELNIPPFYPPGVAENNLRHRNGADCHADCGCDKPNWPVQLLIGD